MSTMTCRDCHLGNYGAQPDRLFRCDECGHQLDIDTAYFHPEEVVVVDESGILHSYLTPAACLAWMEEIADFPTGDWARAQEALRAYRRAVSELRDALNAGLPYLTPDLLMTDVD
ncbi:hypothetical protein OG432_10865 [Streptomyces sp. NBC_00442]|uniref:hypothetical protein n=1 Tax=Streptomyces sp. NBC_00442 TaxID=2903651 RepID=UPI002E1C07E7